MRVQAFRREFTLNQVFGTICDECGWVSFDAVSPRECGECGSTNLESAEGCEIPNDADTYSAVLEGSASDLAGWMRARSIDSWQGDNLVYCSDGWAQVNDPAGLTEEIWIKGDPSDLAQIIEKIESGDLGKSVVVSDRDLYSPAGRCG